MAISAYLCHAKDTVGSLQRLAMTRLAGRYPVAAKVRMRMARDSRPLCSVKASISFDSLVPSCIISVILKLLVWVTLRPWFVMILLYSLYCGFVNLCARKKRFQDSWVASR